MVDFPLLPFDQARGVPRLFSTLFHLPEESHIRLCQVCQLRLKDLYCFIFLGRIKCSSENLPLLVQGTDYPRLTSAIQIPGVIKRGFVLDRERVCSRFAKHSTNILLVGPIWSF
jgi:hypothetical protein